MYGLRMPSWNGPACASPLRTPPRPPAAGSDESDEESEPEEESEDEEAPDAVPLKGTVLKPVKPRARSLIDDEAEESSGEEEEDEDMEGGWKAGLAIGGCGRDVMTVLGRSV